MSKPKDLYLVMVVTAMDDVPLMMTYSKQAAVGKARSARISEIQEALDVFGAGGACLFNLSVTTFKYVYGYGYKPDDRKTYENRYIEEYAQQQEAKRASAKSRMKIKRRVKK